MAGVERRFPNSLGTREKERELANDELTAANRSLVMREHSDANRVWLEELETLAGVDAKFAK